ncbi:MAG: hypothetical protein ACXWLV_02730 [Rhizomicrobium sp.]
MTLSVGLIASQPETESSLATVLSKTGLTVWKSRSFDEFCANVARPGTLCLVVAMPGVAGLEMVEYLRALRIATPAILIADMAEMPPAKRLADARVLDVISQTAASRELLGWIECVCVTRMILMREHILHAEPRWRSSDASEFREVA